MDAERQAILWEERGITRTLLRFGRSLDTGDWDSYLTCFTELVSLNFERLTGHAEVRIETKLMCRWADLFLSPTRRHHSYSNFDITLDGQRAHAKVYFTARHWKATDHGESSNTQYGWYDFWLTKAGEDWKIHRIKHDFQWVDGNGALFDVTEPELARIAQQIFTDENKRAAVAALAV
ncbi:hypothetical protein ASE00_07370 [Sphingomonas sp. Root710]|uniref:nuclear transport factor 2 family protein n=1 Tax=Sphingomonas sp. Root710 TaxID=1736594 RepID=UPI0006F32F95|nr:nuclear transport factor 2 family protein [Sphingomonas sp. Root710]KRB86511.1 hypothetical protein ASE00_07370 [Sphingomonas sp. Root710]